jgi:hypothetical protein
MFLLMLPVCGLIAASCAHMAAATAGAEGSQVAAAAATQAAAAATQAAAALQSAATQIAEQIENGQVPSTLPSNNGKLIVIDTPTVTIVSNKGQTIFIRKATPIQDDGSANAP